SAGAVDQVDTLAQRAWRVLPPLMERVPERLKPWAERRWPLQVCLCDIWHDHVLFSGDAVTGIIDYGSVRHDHPAVDLARLLGSLAGDDAELTAAGLAAYRGMRRLGTEDEELIRALDVTG